MVNLIGICVRNSDQTVHSMSGKKKEEVFDLELDTNNKSKFIVLGTTGFATVMEILYEQGWSPHVVGAQWHTAEAESRTYTWYYFEF